MKDVSSLDALHAKSAQRKLWHTTKPQFHSGTDKSTGSETAFTQVCRLYEQSQQQHQEMMNQFINMGSNRGQYQQQSKLSELQKMRPPTFSHTNKPLEADDWLRDMERKLIIA